MLASPHPMRGSWHPRSGFLRPAVVYWPELLDCRAMSDNEMVKRLAWAGLLAGIGALASIVTTRIAAMIYRRAFGEDPPE
jgi:hypothetical protein